VADAAGHLTFSPLTAERWPALEDLFGRAGASNGCWCMYWRVGPRYRDRPREDNKRDLERLARAGPPPGLLAFYVRRTHRRRGVMGGLIDAAVGVAGSAGAPAVEAYPVDTSVPGHTRNLFLGVASVFAEHGFEVVARRQPDRPIMRRFLGTAG